MLPQVGSILLPFASMVTQLMTLFRFLRLHLGPGRLLPIGSLLLLLCGCVSRSDDYLATTKMALLGSPDIHLTAEQVAAIPHASAYLKVGEAPRAFVVLAFAEQDELSWVSADRNLFVMQHGRLIRTAGLPVDLRYLDRLSHDPLREPKLAQGQHWERLAEWSVDEESGRQLHSRFLNRGMQSVKILDKHYQLILLEEKVLEPASGKTFTNQFWIDPHSALVRQSRQYLGPDRDLLEFTLLKPFKK